MKYYVINIELKSVDVFKTEMEAIDLINHFFDEGYVKRDLRIIRGELVPITVSVGTPDD